jgi:predicted amidohydrolase
VAYETVDEWRKAAWELNEALAAIDHADGDGGLRTAIFVLWRQMVLAPSTVQHLYRQISEEQILRTAATLRRTAAEPGFSLTLHKTNNNTEIVREIGGLLRALETELSEGDLGETSLDPNVDWHIVWREEAAFFVPIPRSAWREPKPEAKDFRPFTQRGLIRARIVPTHVDGSVVRFYLPDRPSRGERRVAFGAVLIPNLTFDEVTGPTTFRITQADSPDMIRHILEACEGAHDKRCVAAIFPELTINDISLAFLRKTLASKPWADSGKLELQTPAVVIGGSWHSPCEGGYANVATILDGDGNVLFKYHKRFAYIDQTGRSEDIIPGNEFPVLVLNEGLFTLGICLDYCNRVFATPYGILNVDFVLVPSCGNEVTMTGHIRTASDLHESHTTRSFVVQQAYPAIANGLGYILPPDGAPKKQIQDVVSMKAWTVFTP